MSPRPDLPGILVHAIHRLHRNAVQTKLSAMGLEGVGSPMILMLLKRRGAEGGGAYQRELADALRISPAAIAMSLQSLERAGYVARREDPGDQRRKRVVIRPGGRRRWKPAGTPWRRRTRRCSPVLPLRSGRPLPPCICGCWTI